MKNDDKAIAKIIELLERQGSELSESLRVAAIYNANLRAQVAWLQAWKDAVPVDAIRVVHDGVSEFDSDLTMIQSEVQTWSSELLNTLQAKIGPMSIGEIFLVRDGTVEFDNMLSAMDTISTWLESLEPGLSR